MEKPVAQAPEKAASEEKLLDDKELELERERKLKKEQKAREKEEKKLKAKQKEAARLQAQATSDGPKKSEKKQKKKAADDENPEDFIDPETLVGRRNRLHLKMAKQYSPSTVEKSEDASLPFSWYAWWESAGYFGQTLQAQTTLCYRECRYNALWVPGVDHAGIATQVVVEKKLMRERKLTRHDIGRDKFISEYGGTILGQLRRLGASLDWSREVKFLLSLVEKEAHTLCFTMDDQRSKAVTEAFVRLHKDGLVYRDYRLVNWDCTLLTAISDIEVDHLELKEETMLKVPGYSSPVQFGVLISFAYPLEEGLGEIIVATTRIETMLGDTAIAVHPEDKRYKHLHGKHAIHPFNGRKLKIICDAVLVDPTFGTGAVKITPAHDPNDFEVGKRHNLEFINIFTDDGKINSNGGAQFEGMPRFAARVAVIDALKEKGLYKDTKKNEMNLGICSRSNDVVEPMIKPQWFVNCHTMAKAGLDAVRSKKIEIIPQQYEQDWYRISLVLQSDKINLDIKRVVGYRQWCNKLWNAIRFAMGKLGDHYTPPATIVVSSMPPVCKWILEAVKPYFFNDSQEFDSARAACRDALWVCLDNGLRLLHPFMPYVTEELWQRLPQPKDSCRKNSIMISEYPSIVKILAESDETPPDCSTAVVNKDLSVYLQLQGALNAEVELEKLRKKRDEIQKLQHALSQKMEASGYREKAPPSVQEEDMRKLTAFFEQLRVIGEAEKKLDATLSKKPSAQGSPPRNISGLILAAISSAHASEAANEDNSTGVPRNNFDCKSKVYALVACLKLALDCFFAVWFVVGNVIFAAVHSVLMLGFIATTAFHPVHDDMLLPALHNLHGRLPRGSGSEQRRHPEKFLNNEDLCELSPGTSSTWSASTNGSRSTRCPLCKSELGGSTAVSPDAGPEVQHQQNENRKEVTSSHSGSCSSACPMSMGMRMRMKRPFAWAHRSTLNLRDKL
ncbi:hypothetical protein ZWY2020_032661 [Hordeum vulgare]|nr:hypothetical protein ZWY2020_032661 [Hordeum vulgare]